MTHVPCPKCAGSGWKIDPGPGEDFWGPRDTCTRCYGDGALHCLGCGDPLDTEELSLYYYDTCARCTGEDERSEQ